MGADAAFCSEPDIVPYCLTCRTSCRSRLATGSARVAGQATRSATVRAVVGFPRSVRGWCPAAGGPRRLAVPRAAAKCGLSAGDVMVYAGDGGRGGEGERW